MRKVRLDIDALEVESFATGEGDGEGTVRAHSDYENSELFGSCENTCQLFCAGGGTGTRAGQNTCAYGCPSSIPVECASQPNYASCHCTPQQICYPWP